MHIAIYIQDVDMLNTLRWCCHATYATYNVADVASMQVLMLSNGGQAPGFLRDLEGVSKDLCSVSSLCTTRVTEKKQTNSKSLALHVKTSNPGKSI